LMDWYKADQETKGCDSEHKLKHIKTNGDGLSFMEYE